MEWQTIETALRDGTDILVCCRYEVDGEFHRVYWVDCFWENRWLNYPRIIAAPHPPTHWMPILPMPENER